MSCGGGYHAGAPHFFYKGRYCFEEMYTFTSYNISITRNGDTITNVDTTGLLWCYVGI